MMWRFHQCQRVVRHGTVNHVQHAFKQHLPTGNKSSQLRFFSGASSSDSVSRQDDQISMNDIQSFFDDLPSEQIQEVVTAAAPPIDSLDAAVKSITELGNAPSEVMLKVFDVIHATTGLPWWGTIVAATFAMRILLFPITISSMKQTAKMTQIKPQLEKLKQDAESGLLPTTELHKKTRDLFKNNNVNPIKPLLVPVTQLPLFISTFYALQIAQDYCPEYSIEGLYWFTNLSLADPTYALPVISSLSMIGTFLYGSAEMDTETFEKMRMPMIGVSIITLPLVYQLPSGVFVFWIANNAYSLTQTMILRTPGVKPLLGVPNLAAAAPGNNSMHNLSTSPFRAAVAKLNNTSSTLEATAVVPTFDRNPKWKSTPALKQKKKKQRSKKK